MRLLLATVRRLEIVLRPLPEDDPKQRHRSKAESSEFFAVEY